MKCRGQGPILSMRSKSSNGDLGGLNPITSVLIRDKWREIWRETLHTQEETM